MKGFHGPQQVFNVIGIKAPGPGVETLERESGAAAARLGSDAFGDPA
jgi:hypothetical protein